MQRAVILHSAVDALGHATQGQLAQSDQVPLFEEAFDRAARLVRQVDFPLAQALDQVVGGKIDQLDLVGRIEDHVGNRLANDHARDLRHDVVQALQVLNVERGVNVDAGLAQPLDILPALGMRHAGRVGVGQLVDQDQLGMGGERPFEVELLQLRAAVLDRPPGQHVEPHQQGLRLGADMRLEIADQDVDPLFGHLAAGFEHRIRLADARRRAEEDLQLAPLVARFFRLHAGEQGIGVRSFFGHGGSRKQ